MEGGSYSNYYALAFSYKEESALKATNIRELKLIGIWLKQY